MKSQKVLLIDNYDSFTYNIFHYLEKIGVTITVCKNDEISWDLVEEHDKIVISPGPGLPKDAGKTMELIGRYINEKPMLGICLGMQAIAEYFGGTLYNQTQVKHGVREMITLKESRLYTNLPSNIYVGLYHSWAIDISNVTDLIPTAYSENNILMSMEHKSLPITAVQYHPESIMTDFGIDILKNFIEYY